MTAGCCAYAIVVLRSAALSGHLMTWFRTSLLPTRRMMTQVMTTCVLGLGHRSAQSLCDPRPFRHTTTGGRVTSFANREGGSSICPCSMMSRDEGDAASECSMFWKSVSVFGSESVPSWTGVPSAFVDKGSIVKHTALPSLIQSMHQNNRCRGSLRHYISRVLQSPLPCPKEIRRLETSHRPLISHLLPRDSPLPDGECRKHSAISPSRCLGHFHRSCGYLFPHIHPQVTENFYNFRLGTPYSNPHCSVERRIKYIVTHTY